MVWVDGGSGGCMRALSLTITHSWLLLLVAARLRGDKINGRGCNATLSIIEVQTTYSITYEETSSLAMCACEQQGAGYTTEVLR